MENQKEESTEAKRKLSSEAVIETKTVDHECGLISVYDTHTEAETAVKQMQRAGFDMKKLSIVGRDFHTDENVIGYYNMGDRAKFWGKYGAFWGGLFGLLFGSALFVIPGVGPIVVAGSFVAALASIIEGAVVVGGLSAFGAALYSLGIKRNSILSYETEIKAGKYLMIAHGSASELKKAREINENSGAKNLTDFDPKEKILIAAKMH